MVVRLFELMRKEENFFEGFMIDFIVILSGDQEIEDEE